MIINVIKILLPTSLAFVVGIAMTPRLANWMYKNKLWRRSIRVNETITNEDFAKINNSKEEISTPRVGGIVIWASVLVTISLIWIVSKIAPSDLTAKLDFYSRNQTLVPLASLILGSLLGLVDDMIEIRGRKMNTRYDAEIIFRYIKIGIIVLLGAVIGFWFYDKLGVSSISVPFSIAKINFGFLFIPFFIFVLVSTFSGGVIDGLDGLAGGVLSIIFGAYSVIAFGQNQIDVAALCGVIAGSIMAFLWFNVPPARFYMGETGMMGLLVVLTVVAFLTDTVLILPLIALPLVISSASSLIQIVSYKYFGHRRVFKIAPLHHHFRALGWSREKIVMRYWVVSVVVAILGVIITFVSK